MALYRSSQVCPLILCPRGGQLVLDGIRQPPQHLNITFTLLGNQGIDIFKISDNGRKRKGDRCRAYHDLAQHRLISQFRWPPRRAFEPGLGTHDFAPINPQLAEIVCNQRPFCYTDQVGNGVTVG